MTAESVRERVARVPQITIAQVIANWSCERNAPCAIHCPCMDAAKDVFAALRPGDDLGGGLAVLESSPSKWLEVQATAARHAVEQFIEQIQPGYEPREGLKLYDQLELIEEFRAVAQESGRRAAEQMRERAARTMDLKAAGRNPPSRQFFEELAAAIRALPLEEDDS